MKFTDKVYSNNYIILAALLVLVVQVSRAQQQMASSDIKVNDYVYGSLLTPEIPTKKLAIIIAGSGPTDRNGNQQMARNNSLKKLAESLASNGIATFRYDKRILTLLKKNALQEEKLRFDDFVDDAVSAINFFKQGDRFTEIYVIGHSQGSLVGMLAVQQSPVEGYISLAGSGQTIDATISDQIGIQMPKLKPQAQEAFATLRKEGKVKDFSPALTSILRPSVQPFMASWMKYDPTIEIANVREPILILNGTKDIQVSTEEAERLRNAAPTAAFTLIEDMNHIFVLVEGDDLENTKTYNQTSLPISSELIEVISGFINKQ